MGMTSPSSDLNPARITMYGADRAKAISGRTQIPVVVFPDGTHFTEPTDAELAAKLDEAIAA